MEKTYILQKNLPDGAASGDRYIKDGDQYYNERLGKSKSPVIEHNSYFTWQVENNSEWFVEEKPKEWEILSYKGRTSGSIYKLHNKFWKSPNNVQFSDTPEGIKRSGCVIHSVRRLSDGETFSVGEHMTYDGVSPYSWSSDNNYGCLIESFNIYNDYIYVNSHYLNQRKDISQWVKLFPSTSKEETKLEVISLLHHTTTNDGVYEIRFNKMLGKGDGERIKKAIELILNN